MSTSSTPLSISQLLSSNQFAYAKLLGYRLQLVLAYQIMMVAVGWHIYELTRDPLSLGLIGLAEVLPYFSSALFAGYAIDHYSRRWFGVLAALMMALNSLTLLAVAAGYLRGGVLYWIYATIAFTGLARAFIAPSYSALMAIILPRESYARGAGIGTSAFQIGLIGGPAVGGLLVGFASKSVAYGLCLLLCLSATVVLFSLRVKAPPPADDTPVFTSIAQGLRFVWRNQVLFSAQMLDMFAVLFGGMVAMLPAFIQEIYHSGPQTMGLLRAAPAVGAIFTSVYLAKHPINLHAGRILLFAVAGFGLCIIAFALSTHVYLAALFLLLSGVCDGVSVVLRSTIMQLATPDRMRGRVAAINGIFIGSSNELGAFESGVTARLMGLVPSVLFGGVMTLAVVGVTAHKAPKLRDLALSKLH